MWTTTQIRTVSHAQFSGFPISMCVMTDAPTPGPASGGSPDVDQIRGWESAATRYTLARFLRPSQPLDQGAPTRPAPGPAGDLWQVLHDCTLSDADLELTRRHAVWTARSAILERWGQPDNTWPLYVYAVADLTLDQVVGDDIYAALGITRSVVAHDATSELAISIAHAIYSPTGHHDAATAHLARRLTTMDAAARGSWAQATAGAWWIVWGRTAAGAVANWLGPLNRGVADKDQSRRRNIYAHIAQQLSSCGVSPTETARWLGITRRTVYSYLD